MRGFTLIETIIYIALLGLIMSGTLLAVWNILQSSGKLSVSTTIQEEGNFVLRKIDWALSGASTITTSGSGCDQTLSVVRYDGVTASFQRNANAIELNEGSGYLPITTSNVSATCLKFNSVTVGSITGVTATTTLSTFDFATTKYIRK